MRFTSSPPRFRRISTTIVLALLLAPLIGATSLCSTASAHTGQYRGPINELKEFFRGQNPRLRPPKPNPLGTEGIGNGTPARRRVPPVGADGQGYLRWEFWWEHNKDGYLGLRNAENRDSSTIRGSADFLLGGSVKDRVPLVDGVDITTRRETIVPMLLKGTRHSDPEVRAASWIALGKTAVGVQADAFIRGVKDGNADVQKAALLGVGLLGSPEGVPILMAAMRNEGRTIRTRMAAAIGLAFIEGSEVTQLLSSFLRWNLPRVGSDATEMSYVTLRALGIHGDASVLPQLESLARSRGGDVRLRAEVIATLGRLRDRAAIPTLLRAAGDRSLPVRRAAVTALGEIDVHSLADDELTQLEAHRARWKRDLSERALAELDALIERRDKESAGERAEIVKQRDRIARTLIEIIDEDSDVQVRNYACIALARNGGKGAYEALLEAFDSGYSISLQGFAALALGIHGDPAAGPVLLERLGRAGYESHRGAVAIGLGLLRERAAIPGLTAILLYRGLDSSLRGYCAEALGLIGDRDQVPDLHRILESERQDETLLRGVALAVGMLGDRGSIQPLRRVLSDSKNPHTREVRGAVSQAFGLIRDRESVAAMIETMTRPVSGDRKVRSQTQSFAAVSLGYIGDASLLPKISLLARDHDYRNFVQGLDNLLTVL